MYQPPKSYPTATQQLREPPLQVGHVELVNVPGKVRLIYIYNSFSFEATEMVLLTSKWSRIQPEIQIWADQVVAGSWTLV